MNLSLSPVLFGAGLIDVNPGLTLWTLVTFLIVAFILRKAAWGPMMSFIHDREKAIEDSIEAAKREREEAQRLVDALLQSENPEFTSAGKRIIAIIGADELEKKF